MGGRAPEGRVLSRREPCCHSILLVLSTVTGSWGSGEGAMGLAHPRQALYYPSYPVSRLFLRHVLCNSSGSVFLPCFSWFTGVWATLTSHFFSQVVGVFVNFLYLVQPCVKLALKLEHPVAPDIRLYPWKTKQNTPTNSMVWPKRPCGLWCPFSDFPECLPWPFPPKMGIGL